jgi:excisionase family DNA binding protein
MPKPEAGKRKSEDGNGRRRMLTMREACRVLNVHGNTLRRWSDLGLIKAYRIGLRGDRRFKQEDIDALLEARARPYRVHASRATVQLPRLTGSASGVPPLA